MRLTLSKKALILVTIPLVFEILFVVVLACMLMQVEVERQREQHAILVATEANELLKLLLDAGTSSVIHHLTGSRSAKLRFDKCNRQLKTLGVEFKALVRDYPSERAAFEDIERQHIFCMAALRDANEHLQAGDRLFGMKKWVEMQEHMNKLFASAKELVDQQHEIQRVKSLEQAKTRKNIMYLIIAGVGLNIAIAISLAAYFNRGTASRMKLLIENIKRLSANQPLKESIKGTDEIAQLDEAFRKMASSLAEATRKERAVIDNAMDVICSITPDGKFQAVNPAALQVWGHEPESLLQTRLSSLIVPADFEQTQSSVQEIISTQGSGCFENRIKHKDATIRDMQWSVIWSSNEKALFCVVRDISERKRIDQLKRDFVAMISHDLRTPLTSIQGFLSLLSVGAYGELTKDGNHSLNVTEANIERLINLVNNLLDIEKMESGMLQLEMAPASIRSVIDRSVQSVEGFATQQKVKLEIEEDSVDSIVDVDADRLVQVVVNLLSNAIKFSPKNETVVVGAHKRDDGTVEVSVSDRGRGVPDELKESIFERFKQVELDDERQRGGSGLGLAICKAIIERHGGEIGVNSQPTQGSRFWFTVRQCSQEDKVDKKMSSLSSKTSS